MAGYADALALYNQGQANVPLDPTLGAQAGGGFFSNLGNVLGTPEAQAALLRGGAALSPQGSPQQQFYGTIGQMMEGKIAGGYKDQVASAIGGNPVAQYGVAPVASVRAQAQPMQQQGQQGGVAQTMSIPTTGLSSSNQTQESSFVHRHSGFGLSPEQVGNLSQVGIEQNAAPFRQNLMQAQTRGLNAEAQAREHPKDPVPDMVEVPSIDPTDGVTYMNLRNKNDPSGKLIPLYQNNKRVISKMKPEDKKSEEPWMRFNVKNPDGTPAVKVARVHDGKVEEFYMGTPYADPGSEAKPTYMDKADSAGNMVAGKIDSNGNWSPVNDMQGQPIITKPFKAPGDKTPSPYEMSQVRGKAIDDADILVDRNLALLDTEGTKWLEVLKTDQVSIVGKMDAYNQENGTDYKNPAEFYALANQEYAKVAQARATLEGRRGAIREEAVNAAAKQFGMELPESPPLTVGQQEQSLNFDTITVSQLRSMINKDPVDALIKVIKAYPDLK